MARSISRTGKEHINAISNASLKKKAQKRLDAVRKSYDKVGRELVQACDKFRPFLSDWG